MKIDTPHTFEDGDLQGKYLICISDKYGNFTKGREYPVMTPYIRISDNKPAEYRIPDNDWDYYTIGKWDIGTLFELRV